MSKKIVTVLGARPQFIKASVVSHALRKSDQLKEVLVHTGQHFDANMSDVFFEELDMGKPDYFLNVHSSPHGAMTGRMLEQVEKVLLTEDPDAVLVYGDTNSTLAGALAAAKLHIPVAHVESGLRSFNMAMPEEINRILTDRISRWLFVPTKTATENLLREGVNPNLIHATGDVMYDVALHHGQRVRPDTGKLVQLNLKSKTYVLVTVHRAENTDHLERLQVIAQALIATAQKLPVVWPLHPRTRAALKESCLLETLAQHVQILDPLSYLDMVQLEKYAGVIVTDSGGVQKEAFFYQVPCVTLRDETEWVELVDAKWNKLAPPINASLISELLLAALGTRGDFIQPYGLGNAAEKICIQLVKDLTGR
jgi:UDP-GlcNAc3NAcA epimerase